MLIAFRVKKKQLYTHWNEANFIMTYGMNRWNRRNNDNDVDDAIKRMKKSSNNNNKKLKGDKKKEKTNNAKPIEGACEWIPLNVCLFVWWWNSLCIFTYIL